MLKALVLAVLLSAVVDGFATIDPFVARGSSRISSGIPKTRPDVCTPRNKDTSLSLLLDVPDYFFTFTFPILGIMLSISKNFGRLRMEERAWEQRVEEARQKRLREDPTLTEIELRRKEASLEWSAYGKPRMEEERAERQRGERENSRSRVKVMDRDDEYDDDVDEMDPREYRMNDDEIAMFEAEYGIEYDPYYDDPYSEEELPDDIPYNVDKKHGDRIYNNGEIFFKDKESGLFYRQGARPRNLSFWG